MIMRKNIMIHLKNKNFFKLIPIYVLLKFLSFEIDWLIFNLKYILNVFSFYLMKSKFYIY